MIFRENLHKKCVVLTALVMLSTILLLLMLAKGLSAAMHSVYLGVLATALIELLLFFLSSPGCGSQIVRPPRSMSVRLTFSVCLS